jgi:hypothetical protein
MLFVSAQISGGRNEGDAQSRVDRKRNALARREMFRSADAHVEHRVSVSQRDLADVAQKLSLDYASVAEVLASIV